MRIELKAVFLILGLCMLAALPAHADAVVPHQLVQVTLGRAARTPVSGRLLLFAKPAQTETADSASNVDASFMQPTQVMIAAREVDHLQPGGSVQIDADAVAWPQGFSHLAPGRYDLQAVLDLNHDYAYAGRGEGDLLSDVARVRLGPGAPMPALSLTRVQPAGMQAWQVPAMAPQAVRERVQPWLDAARAHADGIDFTSPVLTAFWGRPIHMRGWVLKPPGYSAHADRRYPTVYFTHGFSGGLASLTDAAGAVWHEMESGAMPPMIWVFLDESCATGTHEFADSVNNGPWGTALTGELIPHLEAGYRMDGKPSGRFLQGHSSGGWATLWLQVRYPEVFGGTWSTSPDPGDFHDFTGIDLYAADANVYHDRQGNPRPLVRMGGKVVASFEQFARMERVLGGYGGQLASFEWVFSPRGKDGRPQPMFDRDTGAVHPQVVAYWRRHYDIAHRIRSRWPEMKSALDGKVHVFVGTADTFYLDGAARRLDSAFKSVDGHAEFRYLPGKSHFDLYAKGADRHWLLTRIAWAMYHQARPQADVPAEDRVFEKSAAD